ncbi:MAG: DUF11 domain-containing protein [Solirubrobacterales bacterium]|nr:DUF11 domain-containing protein [Solirubrobacterales bacterium]
MKLKAIIFAAVLALAAFGAASSAQAQKVGNPGQFDITAVSGFMKVGSLDQFELSEGSLSLPGAVAANGTVTVANSDIGAPAFPLCDTPGSSSCEYDGMVTVHIVGDPTGSVNPLTGAANLTINMWISANVTKPVTANCTIGTAGSPLSIPVITGTSGSLTGAPYDPATGLLTLVNGTIAIPGPSGGGLCGVVGGQIGLPSASGNNLISFTMKFTPIATPGVQPVINSYDETIDGGVLTMTGSDAISKPGTPQFQWDYDGNGTWDTALSTNPETTYTYTGSVGTVHHPRLRVVDGAGDSYVGTKPITIGPGRDLSVEAAPLGQFNVGASGTFQVNVTNESAVDMPNRVIATGTLPASLPLTGATGSGWNCSTAGQTYTCHRPSLGAGITAPPISITVGITAAARPTVNTTHTVQGPHDPVSENDSTTINTEVFATDLTIDKHHDYEFRPGADPKNVHVLDVSNVGNIATSTPTTVTDTLPTGLTPLTATGAGWSCNIAGQTVTCTSPAVIGSGQAAPAIQITSDADIVAAGGNPGDTSVSVDNTATVANAGDVNPDNDSDTDPTMILDAPDLAVKKSHVGNPTAGENFDYTIEVENRGGQDTVQQTTITDTLPSNMTYVNGTGTGWTCDAVDQDVTCTYDDPIVSDTWAPPITLTVHAGTPADVVNTAVVANADDPNPNNDSIDDPTSVRLIDLDISAQAEGVYKVNRDGWVTIGLENLGTSSSVGTTVVSSTLPAGVTYADFAGDGWDCSASSGSNVSCDYDDPIAPGTPPDDLKVMVSFTAPAMPDTTMSFHVATANDYEPANDDAGFTADVFGQDLSVDLSHSGNFRVGGNRTYTVDVQNEGTGPTTDPTEVQLDLDPGLTYVQFSGAPAWSCGIAGQQVTCTHNGTIAAEAHADTLSIQVHVEPSAWPQVTSSVTVSTDGDRNAGNDSDQDIAAVAAPDLQISTSHTGAAFRVGTEGTYRFVATNAGDAATTSDTVVTSTVPSGLDFLDADGTGWDCSFSAPDLTCTRSANLAAGTSAAPINVTVMPTTAAMPSVLNEVAVAADNDHVPGNDTASETIPVVAIDLSIALTGPTGTLEVGRDAIYTIDVSNVGTADTINPVVVTGHLPTGVIPGEVSGSGWSCNIDRTNGHEVSCVRDASLAAGAPAPTITVVGAVKPSVVSPAQTSFSVATSDDIESLNDQSNAVSNPAISGPNGSVLLEPDMAPGTSLRVGDHGTYRVRVHNDGGSAIGTGTEVQVLLPDGLVPDVSGNAHWPCSVSGQTVTCTRVPTIPAGQSAPVFPVNFTVTSEAANTVTTTATLDVPGDLVAADNEDSDVQNVSRTDLSVALSSSGTWTAGTEASFDIQVANGGSADTVGPIALQSSLPEGIWYLSATGGGFSCAPDGTMLNCERGAALAAGQSTEKLTVKVKVSDTLAGDLDLNAAISTLDDVEDANDTATIVQSVVLPAVVLRPATIGAKKATILRNGVFNVKVSCPADATQRCEGKAQLKVKPKLRRPGKKKRFWTNVTSTSARYVVAPGESRVVSLRIKSAQRRALAKRKKANGTLTLKPNSTEINPTKGTVTLVAR